MGYKDWSEVRATLPPEVQARADAVTTSYRLRGLREARRLTQAEMADRLDIRQVSVSRMEARADVRVSTLRSVVEAMGGRMEIRAVFPDAEYMIDVGDDVEIHSSPVRETEIDARDAA